MNRYCVKPVDIRSLKSISETALSPFGHKKPDLWGQSNGLNVGGPGKKA